MVKQNRSKVERYGDQLIYYEDSSTHLRLEKPTDSPAKSVFPEVAETPESPPVRLRKEKQI